MSQWQIAMCGVGVTYACVEFHQVGQLFFSFEIQQHPCTGVHVVSAAAHMHCLVEVNIFEAQVFLHFIRYKQQPLAQIINISDSTWTYFILYIAKMYSQDSHSNVCIGGAGLQYIGRVSVWEHKDAGLNPIQRKCEVSTYNFLLTSRNCLKGLVVTNIKWRVPKTTAGDLSGSDRDLQHLFSLLAFMRRSKNEVNVHYQVLFVICIEFLLKAALHRKGEALLQGASGKMNTTMQAF